MPIGPPYLASSRAFWEVYEDMTPTGQAVLTGTPAEGRAAINPVDHVVSGTAVTIDTDAYSAISITALAANVAFTFTGTPVDFQSLLVRIKDAGVSKTINWSAACEAGTEALPTATVAGKTLFVGLRYDAVDAKWACEAAGSRA